MGVAAPYWHHSIEVRGIPISSSVSLWKVSVTAEVQDVSADSSMDMCGDAPMTGFEDCDKIHALRFFAITSLLLSLASGLALAMGFSPISKPGRPLADMRRNLSICGVSIAAAVLLSDLLGIIVAASVEMTDGALNGVGFVFLILELLLVGFATALVVCTLTRWSTTVVTMEAAGVETQHGQNGTPVVKMGKSQSELESSPTLLSSPHNGAQKPKANDSNVPVAEENGTDVESLPANKATVVVAS